jgi:prevent-host-death family protein
MGPMKTITPMDLRRSLGRILDEASAGERFLIERDHKPLAVLVSVEEAQRLEQDPEKLREQRQAALDAIDDWARRYRAGLPPGEEPPTAVEWLRADRDERTRRDRSRYLFDRDEQ